MKENFNYGANQLFSEDTDFIVWPRVGKYSYTCNCQIKINKPESDCFDYRHQLEEKLRVNPNTNSSQ